MALSGRDIRETFQRFFEERGHRRVASSSLVPQGDPTLMFANAGMVQFKRIFTGEETRDYSRATTSQKVMRVSGKHNDLENVGRTPRHHTFFEMLGNFSFGDYFKEGAITYAWELLTNDLGIDPDHLVASVYEEDDEAYDLWRTRIGLPEERVYRLGADENFWTMGDTGPCGPCAEIHFDFHAAAGMPRNQLVGDPSDESGRFLEIWNLVFMQYERSADGKQTPLPKPSIDTGAGLERLAQVLQGVETNYDTDLFVPILNRAQDLASVSLGSDSETDVSLRVIGDHARALTFLIGDGVLPSNEGRGYVLRRILRRASRHAKLLGVEAPMVHSVADAVIDEMGSAYPELIDRRAYITDRIRREEERFLETLTKGLALLEGETAELEAKGQRELPGEIVFKLYDTYGFPIDLTADILAAKKLGIDQAGFDRSMQAQRDRARAAWKGSGETAVGEIYGRIASDVSCEFVGYDGRVAESSVLALIVDGKLVDEAATGAKVEVVTAVTPFYGESGGQVGDRGEITSVGGARVEVSDTQKPAGSLIVHRGRVREGTLRADEAVRLEVDAEARAATVRNHSGTHLLHAALRQVLGPQAMQKGSLVSPERLRFDFTHDSPLSREEIEAIEDRVNEWVEANAAGVVAEMSYDEAIQSGAVAIFEEKYGDRVRVMRFGEFSTELCGGTHASATGDIGVIKIVSETGIAAGIRRIEALTGMGALQHVRQQEGRLRELAAILKAPESDLVERVERLLEDRKHAQREIDQLRGAQRGDLAGDLVDAARSNADGKVLAARVDGVDAKELRTLIDDLRGKLGDGVVLIASETGGKVLIAVGVSKALTDRWKAGDLVREAAKILGGGGGGRPDFAQAGGKDASKIDDAIADFYQRLGAEA